MLEKYIFHLAGLTFYVESVSTYELDRCVVASLDTYITEFHSYNVINAANISILLITSTQGTINNKRPRVAASILTYYNYF